jgi:GH25 family lysozyme M1 (1,4-beta-N-acetylmuramidase)
MAIKSTANQKTFSYPSGYGLIAVLSGMLFFLISAQVSAFASDRSPWRDKSKAIVLDAYEKNPINWEKVATNPQIAGFIAKSSDGLPPKWSCNHSNDTKQTLCKKTYQNYWLKKQLYQSRRLIAKSLGMKWGAYHLGRPGNPIAQANHFLNFAEPDDDELMAIDIEHDDPEKWISFKDAEIFAMHIKRRTGRYPVLYTNHDTAKRIASRRAEFPILSRLPLWYARFRSSIPGVFPMGNWDNYELWQFSAGPNCNKRRCLYRVKGTETNIDVNVANYSISELKKAWPFDELVPEREFEAPEEPMLMAKIDDDGNTDQSTDKQFNVNVSVEDIQGGTFELASVPVPSPRAEQGFELASLSQDTDSNTMFGSADLNDAQEPNSVLTSLFNGKKQKQVKTLFGGIAPSGNEAPSLSKVGPKASYGYSNKQTISKSAKH